MRWQRLLTAVAVSLSLALALNTPSTSASASASSGSIDTDVVAVGDVSGNATQLCFPDSFIFGSATAAYQVEGAWNQGGRTPSIWDAFCRSRADKECADVADDFFHRYKDDVQLMLDTGLTSFRFSISWSRVMHWDPSTQRMTANPAGLAFYHAVIDELRSAGIVPILTLYHWDLPLELHQELSPRGWLNRALVTHFVDYAELMFREYGAKVDFWSTFNEPWTFTTQGYGSGTAAPGLKNSPTNEYTVAHHVLVAHGHAVAKFRALQQEDEGVVHRAARIGIVLNSDFAYPLDPTDASDVAAADRKMQFSLGWFLTPIVTGEYPRVMRERAGDNLPRFTSEDAAVVRQSYDVLMLNHYSSQVVTDCASPHSREPCAKKLPGWDRDLGVDNSRIPSGARHSDTDEQGHRLCTWFSGYPRGILDTIRWMHAQDTSAEILLTENGWCGNAQIENEGQLWYFQSYLQAVHEAITKDKIPVIGYTAWSFLDNYEWGSFQPRFGLYYVNFTAETGTTADWAPRPTDLARIPRKAAKWYATLATSKCMEALPEALMLPGAPWKGEEEDVDGNGNGNGSDASAFSNTVMYALIAVVVAVVASVGVVVWRHHLASERVRANEASPLLRP